MAQTPRVNFTTGMQNSQSIQPKVVSTPPAPDPATKDPQGSKYLIYCSHATQNFSTSTGKVARIRNHVLRTDDEELIEFLRKEFMSGRPLPFVLKEVTEEELQELLTEAAPVVPAATFESIPNQGQDDPNPDLKQKEVQDGKEANETKQAQSPD